MDSWFLAAIHGSKGNEKMVSEDPLRRFCLQKLKNIPIQLICIVLVGIQAWLINDHLVKGHGDKNFWAWFTADAVVIISFIVGFVLREWRIKRITTNHKEETGFKKGLPFASLSWLIYSVMLGARVVIIFKRDLEFDAEIGNLKITVCLTAIVCVFFTSGHHHNHESLARRAAIMALIKTFTIDILDTVDVLDVLFETSNEFKGEFPLAMEDIVLSILVINLARPSFVLWSLFIDHFTAKYRSLQIKIIKSVFELILINIPLLVVRVYIGIHFDDFISVFLVKNILGIIFGIMEIYDCSWDILQEKRTSNTELNDAEKDRNNSQPETPVKKSYDNTIQI